jgi:hypothetical protein
MTAPHVPDGCCVCTEELSVLDFTVCIGEHEAHDACAHDRSLVAHCCVCGTLGVLCLADRLAEVAAERAEAESEVRHAG